MTVIGQTAVTAIEHEDPTFNSAIPSEMIEMARQIDEAGKKRFPFFYCRAENSLGHTIYFRGSLEAKENWPHGYIDNSPTFSGHIFCAGQWHNEGNTGELYSFQFPRTSRGVKGKMISRKRQHAGDIVLYVIKQLNKLGV